MEVEARMVDFGKYCPICTNSNKPENDYPCNECMENDFNVYSDRPAMYKEDKNNPLYKERKETIKIAKDLGYPKSVIAELENATNVQQLTIIMATQRHKEIGDKNRL